VTAAGEQSESERERDDPVEHRDRRMGNGTDHLLEPGEAGFRYPVQHAEQGQLNDDEKCDR
jgi:hypothetical protein